MTQFYYHTWTDDEDRKLSDIMLKGLSARKKTLSLFNEAAAVLGRTAKSCQNRWYEIKAREAV